MTNPALKIKVRGISILRDHILNSLISWFYNDCFEWYNKMYTIGDEALNLFVKNYSTYRKHFSLL